MILAAFSSCCCYEYEVWLPLNSSSSSSSSSSSPKQESKVLFPGALPLASAGVGGYLLMMQYNRYNRIIGCIPLIVFCNSHSKLKYRGLSNHRSQQRLKQLPATTLIAEWLSCTSPRWNSQTTWRWGKSTSFAPWLCNYLVTQWQTNMIQCKV